MRIGQHNGLSISSILSGTNKMGNVPLPDFNGFHFNTKSTPAMSDDKFKENIIEQAKKDQAAGKFQPKSPAYINLMKSYVSAASPDRKGIITEGLTQITKQPPNKTINYLHLFLFGEVKYEKGAEELSYAEFYDSNGELIATYAGNNNSWTFFTTNAENARTNEFLSIYNSAWGEAAKNAKNAAKIPNFANIANENSNENSFEATV